MSMHGMRIRSSVDDAVWYKGLGCVRLRWAWCPRMHIPTMANNLAGVVVLKVQAASRAGGRIFQVTDSFPF